MKRIITSFLSLIFILNFCAYASDVMFDDVFKSDIYYNDIKSLYDKNIVSGYGDGEFRPGSYITQAEFLSLVLKASENPRTGNDWAVNSLVFARELGYIDKLTPVNALALGNDYVTREFASVVLARAMGYAIGNVAYFENKINDYEKIKEELRPFVLQMYEKGILESDENGNFNPAGFVTRGQACRFINLCFFETDGRKVYEENEMTDNPLKAKKVIAGYTANYIIDENDDLWVFGSNTNGLAGTGSVSGYIITPVKIAENIKSVSAGITHSFAVTNDNKLLGWGNNEACQLGIETEEKLVLNPIEVARNVTDAFAFESSSVIIDMNKKAYGYGVMCRKDADNLYNYGTIPSEKLLSDDAVSAGWSGGSFVIQKNDGTLLKIVIDDETSAITNEVITTDAVEISTGMNDIFVKKSDRRFYNYSNWPTNIEGYWGMLDVEGIIVRNAVIASGGVCGSVTVDSLGNAYINTIDMETGDVTSATSPEAVNIKDASFGWNNVLFIDAKGNVWQKGRTFSGNPLENTAGMSQPTQRIYFFTLK